MDSVKLVDFSLECPMIFPTFYLGPSLLSEVFRGPVLFWCFLAAQSSVQSSDLSACLSSTLRNSLILCSVPLVLDANRKSNLLIYRGQVLSVDNNSARRYKSPYFQIVLSDFNVESWTVFKIKLCRQLFSLHTEFSLLCVNLCVGEAEISSDKFLNILTS